MIPTIRSNSDGLLCERSGPLRAYPRSVLSALPALGDSRLLLEQQDLLKSKKVEIYVSSSQQLYALVKALDGQKKLPEKPLLVILPPNHERRSLAEIAAFLRSSPRTTPEKGVDGTYNRVVIETRGLGGGKPKIPFQPGLAMGSIVRCDNLHDMENYAKIVAEKELLEQQLSGAEKEIEMIFEKISSKAEQIKDLDDRSKPFSKAMDEAKTALANAKLPGTPPDPIQALKEAHAAVINGWLAQVAQIQDYINKTLVPKLTAAPAMVPAFQGFQQSMETPIDIARSKITSQPIAFDSLEFTSEYVNRKSDTSEMHNRADQSASSSAAKVSASYGWFAKVDASYSSSKAAANRVNELHKRSDTQGILKISAMTTTRNVKMFANVEYDLAKLRALKTVMESSTISDKDKEFYGISVPQTDGKPSGEPFVILLTQCVLGGGFTALITILDQSSVDNSSAASSSSSSRDMSVSASGGFGPFRAAGGYSSSTSSSAQSEDESLKQLSSTRVNIEIFSEGVIPSFSTKTLEKEIIKQLDLGPGEFSVTQRNRDDVKQILDMSKAVERLTPEELRLLAIPEKDLTPEDKPKAQAAKERQKELDRKNDEIQSKVIEFNMMRNINLEEAQSKFINAFKGAKLKSEKTEQKVHTVESVMDAYDSYATQIAEDIDCGIPVGFNYRILTLTEIRDLVKKLDIASTDKTPSPVSSATAPSLSSAAAAAAATTAAGAGGSSASSSSAPSSDSRRGVAGNHD